MDVYAPTIATLKFCNIAMLVGRRSAGRPGVAAKALLYFMSEVYFFLDFYHGQPYVALGQRCHGQFCSQKGPEFFW
jgi:hypothetical protein